jgi:hypothetical protein
MRVVRPHVVDETLLAVITILTDLMADAKEAMLNL